MHSTSPQPRRRVYGLLLADASQQKQHMHGSTFTPRLPVDSLRRRSPVCTTTTAPITCLLEELHADVSVVLVGASHLLHVFHGFHRLALQHSDLQSVVNQTPTKNTAAVNFVGLGYRTRESPVICMVVGETQNRTVCPAQNQKSTCRKISKKQGRKFLVLCLCALKLVCISSI